MADVSASVDISVHGAGALEEAADAARSLARALKEAQDSAAAISGAFEGAARSLGSLRDDALEAAKALKSIRDSGVEMGDVAAAAEAAARGLGNIRDEATEAAAAVGDLDAEGAALGGDAAGAEAFAESLGSVRDKAAEAAAAEAALGHEARSSRDAIAEQGAASEVSAGKLAQMAGMVGAARKRYEEFSQGLGGADSEKIRKDMEGIAESLRSGGLGETQGNLGAGKALGDYEKNLVKLKKDLADADKLISKSSDGLDDAAQAAGDADAKYETFTRHVTGLKAALGNFSEIARDSTASGEDLGRAAEELDSQFGRAADSGKAFQGAFSDVRRATRDAASGVGDLADEATKAASDSGDAISSLGDSLTSLPTKIGPMTGLIGGLVGLVGGVGPAFATAFTGAGVSLGGFAALAVPTISKIVSSYSDISAAQKTYTAAQQLEAADPSKSHLADQALALTKLKIAYQDVPPAIRPALKAFGEVKTQYMSMAKAFEPEVLKVATKGLNLVSDAMGRFLKPAAAEGGSLVLKGLKDLQKFADSPGFAKTFNDLLKETPGALKAVGGLGSSLGKFLGDAFGGVGVKGSESFLKTLGTFARTIGPGVGTGVKGLADGLQSILKASTTGYGDISKLSTALTGLDKINLSNLKSQLEQVAGIKDNSSGKGGALGLLNQIEDAYHKLPQNWQDRINQAGKTAIGQISGTDVLNNAAAQQKAIDNLVHGGGHAVKVPVHLDPKVDKGALATSLTGGGPLNLPVKPKAIDKGALRESLTGGGPLDIPVTAKIHVDKAALAKSLTAGGLTPPSVNAKAKITGTDTSGLKGGDAKVPATAKVDKVDTAGIQGAAKNVQIHGLTVSLANAKLSGLGALSGQLSAAGAAAGKAFDSGLSSAIQSGGAAAVGDARAIVSQIRGALAGMGAAGNAAGAALGAGLASGIRASTGAAVAAATAMANAVTSAVAKAHETQSPSKKFEKLGKADVQGLVLGLEGGKAQVAQAAKDLAMGVTTPFTDKTITDHIKKLETDLTKALKDKQITAGEDTALTSWLKSDNTKLQGLAAQRASLETQIQGADSLFKSVQSGAIAGGNIATLAGSVTSPGQMELNEEQGNFPAPGAPNPPTSIQAGLKQYLGQVKAFRSDIVKLKSEGLDETSLKQLLQAGVTSGLPAAKMLLSGGEGGVKEVAKLQGELAKAAEQLGVTGANASYESGSEIGKGLASGLKASLSGVESSIKELAEAIGKALGGKTGKGLAQLGKDLGKDFGDGVGKGAKDAAHSVPIIRDKSGKVVSLGGGGIEHPMPILKGTTGPVGSQPIHVDVHVMLDGKEIANTTQTQTLQRAHRNTSSGLVLPGRRA